MGAHTIKDEDGRLTGVITLIDAYEYKGFHFEYHPYLGITKLKKNLDPAARSGRKFYKVIEEWLSLSETERKETQIFG